MRVPRGEWFEYKYSRGDWGSVEKGEGCAEVQNRYRFAAEGSVGFNPRTGETARDVVLRWADGC